MSINVDHGIYLVYFIREHLDLIFFEGDCNLIDYCNSYNSFMQSLLFSTVEASAMAKVSQFYNFFQQFTHFAIRQPQDVNREVSYGLLEHSPVGFWHWFQTANVLAVPVGDVSEKSRSQNHFLLSQYVLIYYSHRPIEALCFNHNQYFFSSLDYCL